MFVLAVLRAKPAFGYHEGTERMTQYTAHSLRPGEWQLGLLAFEYGPVRWLYFGTDTLPWVSKIILPVIAPNAHVNVRAFASRPITVGVRAGIYYADLDGVSDRGGGSAFAVPLSLFLSSDLRENVSLHAEATFTRIFVSGNAEVEDLAIHGGGVANTIQLGLLGEYRLTRVTALTLRGRWQPYQSSVRIHSTGRPDELTTTTVNGNVTPKYAQNAWAVLGGVALSWKNFNLQLAVGYGDLFLPTVGVVLPYKGVVPDANLFFRF